LKVIQEEYPGFDLMSVLDLAREWLTPHHR
jgi:hypothetical protein